MWVLLKMRLDVPVPASSGPRLSLSRNTHTCAHTHRHRHTQTYGCHCCRTKQACNLSFFKSVCLIFTYLFIFIHTFSPLPHTPSFVLFHIVFYTPFSKRPNSLWERPHSCQEAASQSPGRYVLGLPWPKVYCTTWRSPRAAQAGECVSSGRFTYLD